ncbi:MAG: hypothetical protein JHC81_04740 [Brevundimonas sp.]|uniref:hypothetical protein n=1 Tax=Brevundimonas sp. TaxID=1871086 RepID=UPI001A324FFE|nr:hypothetical protein [Brevundimonas sp.]MBJ7446821.1 hypothetical protein [Brevundimonas sp.]
MTATLHRLRPAPYSQADYDRAARFAAEVMALTRARPHWNWLVRKQGPVFHAVVSSPDYVPLTQGYAVSGLGSTEAEALADARHSADAIDANAVRGPVAGSC